MDDFKREYKQETLEEIGDNVGQIQDLLDKISDISISSEQINEVFRSLHSIKGNAKSADFNHVADIAHKFEDFFLGVKEGKVSFNQGLKDCLLKFCDSVNDGITILKSDLEAKVDFTDFSEVLDEHLDSSSNSDPSSVQILIADDEPNVVLILEEFISTLFENKKVVKACDGQEAYDICQKQSFDLILTDYSMPNMTGEDFIQKIRLDSGNNDKTPIIMITGFQPNLDISQKHWENVFFLEKPMKFERFNYFIKCCMKLSKAS